MVNFMQKKPEVIAYLRSQYASDVVPDWVGDIKGGRYTEVLESAGLDVPGAMDAESDGYEPEGEPSEEGADTPLRLV